MRKRPRAFHPKKKSIGITVRTISMQTKDGKVMAIAGSTGSEGMCWKFFRLWQMSNEKSILWDWSVPPRVEEKLYLKVVQN